MDENFLETLKNIVLMLVEYLGGPEYFGWTVATQTAAIEPQPVAASAKGPVAASSPKVAALKAKLANVSMGQPTNGGRGVKYIVSPKVTPAMIKGLKLNGNNLHTFKALQLSGKDGVRSAEIAEASGMKIKAVESAIHALRTMQLAKSVPIGS